MPASNTYESITSTTLTNTVSELTFSSIPQTYTDLVIVTSAGVTSGNPAALIKFNSDSGSNYSQTYLYGNGTSAGSSRLTSQTSLQASPYIGLSTTLANWISIINVMNYSNTTTNKTIIYRTNNGSSSTYPGADINVGLWRSTAAISTITFSLASTTFLSGSTFSLYGIKAA